VSSSSGSFTKSPSGVCVSSISIHRSSCFSIHAIFRRVFSACIATFRRRNDELSSIAHSGGVKMTRFSVLFESKCTLYLLVCCLFSREEYNRQKDRLETVIEEMGKWIPPQHNRKGTWSELVKEAKKYLS
jgi:hypothetical protein